VSKNSVLWLGYGDLGGRAAGELIANGFDVSAASRRAKPMPIGGTHYVCNVFDAEDLSPLFEQHWDYLVITMSPPERSEAGYRQAYYGVVQTCLELLLRNHLKPKAIIYSSSTSVYGEGCGERVNESTPAKPLSATAKVLLDTEALLKESDVPSCIVRFSGIYGPGRFRLLQQVVAGVAGDSGYTNRIHADDAAALIVFLLKLHAAGGVFPELLLASDSHPVKSAELRRWLAKKMELPQNHLDAALKPPRASTNRVIDNGLLKSLGFEFGFPSYKEGFAAILKEFLKKPQ